MKKTIEIAYTVKMEAWLLSGGPYGKGYWNRKESIASENLLLVHAQCLLELVQFCLELVFLQETLFMRKKWPLTLNSAESVREEGKIEEEHSDKAVATSESSETADASPSFNTGNFSREKTEENSPSPKVEKEFSESVKSEAKELASPLPKKDQKRIR